MSLEVLYIYNICGLLIRVLDYSEMVIGNEFVCTPGSIYKARAGLRHAVVCPNATGRTKER